MAVIYSQHGVITRKSGIDNAVVIGNGAYLTKRYGNKIWTVESLRVPATGAYTPNGESIYGLLYPYAAFAEINALLPAGWHIPTKSDYEDLISNVGTTVGSQYISESFGGGNESGFNLPLTGYVSQQGFLEGYGVGSYVWTTTPYTTEGSLCNLRCKNNSNRIDVDDYAEMNGVKIQIRVCRDVTSTSTVIGGKTYRTARMPDGKIWLAENLDFKFCNIGGSGSPTTPNAWYYDNDETTYGWEGKKYGLLYNWYAVKFLNDNRSELCPGWHVPSTTEWDTLATACGGASTCGTGMKSTTEWSSGNGTDLWGFTIFPSGGYYGSFDFLGSAASFWTSIEDNSYAAYNRYFDTGTSLNPNNDDKVRSNSLRLIRDSN